MASAIELYQQAYNLDYRQGDWESAEELYQRIIEQYPHSDEKEYAKVHLDRIQRLKGDPKDPELEPVHSGGTGGLAVFCLFLSLILIAGTCFLGYYYWQLQNRVLSQELILQGIVSEQAGDNNAAQMLYEHVRKAYPGNTLAYACLAELFLKHGDKHRAEQMSNEWAIVNPNDIHLKHFTERLRNTKQ